MAAYCRVSTKEEDQANSYEVQKEYYTDKIMSNTAWTMAGIFADKGITGTSAKKREDFMRMIRHCRQKKIDVILTKSVSRFSRNTVDCLYYTVRSFESGDALLEAFRQEPAELVILDIMMPGTDGLTVCRELRAVSDIPIILLTAKDSELDYVMGISQGSDDYLTKPFRPTILLMKVKALLRRVEMDRGKTAAAEDELHYGDIRYSATENAVFCGSTIVALTQTELRLLSYMMKQPEKAYSREELLSAVWGFDSEVETRVTDETLRRIRKKLLQAGSTVSVSTIWGFGYKLKGAERT